MRRGHDREAYLDLIKHIRDVVGPQVRFSSDFISGFCGETEEDHQDTLSLLEEVGYDQAFMFAYSLRDRTHAAHKMEDNVSPEVKSRRLKEVISTFRRVAEKQSERYDLDLLSLVLVENSSKRSTDEFPEWTGKGEGHRRVVFPAEAIPGHADVMTGDRGAEMSHLRPGDYVAVRIVESGTNTLRGVPLFKTSIGEFHELSETMRRGGALENLPLIARDGAMYFRN
jgi:tRNA A37 methylthiotransferase MiaB